MGESKARGLLRELAATGALPAVLPCSASDLLAEARLQGFSGLLLAHLERRAPAWSEDLRPALHAERRPLLVRTLQQIALAARSLAVLERAGIRALPLKGVALAETVYDLESERPMSDVDLLALERWPDAAAALTSAGFVQVTLADHARVLREESSGLVLELHRSFTTAPGLFPFDAEGLWSRRRQGRGQIAQRPSVEDLLLQLGLHAAFQHGLLLSLVQWLDFRRVFERETVDSDRLLALATESRALTSLAAALLTAEAVVAAPIPPALREHLAARLPAGLRRRLAPRWSEPLSFLHPIPAAVARTRWELLAGRRLELLWRTLVLPETANGDTRPGPRLAQAAQRLARLSRDSLASLTGLRRED